jgi:hypothetical protein
MWPLSELAMYANSECMLGYMGSVRIVHNTHVPRSQAKDHFQIESQVHNFLFGPTTIPSLTFSNSHFFSGQSWHASSSSIVMYLWLGAKRPTTCPLADCHLAILLVKLLHTSTSIQIANWGTVCPLILEE